MKAFRTWRYNQFDCPEGKIFMSDNLPGGDWVDTPAKFKSDAELAAEIKKAEAELAALEKPKVTKKKVAKKRVAKK